MYNKRPIGREEISPTESVALSLCTFLLSLSLFSRTYTEFIVPLFYFYFYCLFLLSTSRYCTYTSSPDLGVGARTLTVISVREVFLSLDLPPGIITSRSAQIRDYSLAYRDKRTKSTHACGTSTEEIFLTTRCHRVRPTEITDEDSERSSTPVTVQETRGWRWVPFLRILYNACLERFINCMAKTNLDLYEHERIHN